MVTEDSYFGEDVSVKKRPIKNPKATAEDRIIIRFLTKNTSHTNAKKMLLKIVMKKLKKRSKAFPISLKSCPKSTSSEVLGLLEFVLIMC